MRVRWIALAFVAGILASWSYGNLTTAFVSTLGCMALYAMRRIEGEIRRLREHLAPSSVSIPSSIPEAAFSRLLRNGKNTRSTFPAYQPLNRQQYRLDDFPGTLSHGAWLANDGASEKTAWQEW
jgi:hypothetical protein